MTDTRHYKAFISYSHSDEQWASWLQRSLEKYKLPKTFRNSHPDLPARLYPIFRDRDELASGGELSESIRKAMDDSDALIVICSPAARASRWVNEEIRRFQASGRGERVFCLLVSGSPDPNADDCAFPNAILQNADGKTVHEPLAADATPKGDGKRNAMLKIAAGLLGVGVDDLKQRDAQRQARFWSIVAIGSLLIASLTIGLAIYAFNAKRESEIARKESEMRRQQAEGLIGFMLGDLRKKLEPIGKLELLDSVGDQAMVYFATLGERGTQKELLARAVALKQIGDVRFQQGKLVPALKAFDQSLAQARALYKSDPSNNDHLYELSQAEFWVGYVAWEKGDLALAEPYFQRYMQYSRELLRREPANSDYNMELSYAYSNLGSLARARGNSQVALDNFILSANINAEELKKKPDEIDLVFSYAEGLSWIGSTKADLGDLIGSKQAYHQIFTLLEPISDKQDNAKIAFTLGANLAFEADAELNLGNTQSAKSLITESLRILKLLIAKDPQNARWMQAYNKSEISRLALIPHSEWSSANGTELDRVYADCVKLLAQDPSNTTNIQYLATTLREKSLRALKAGNHSDGLAFAKSAHGLTLKLLQKTDPSPQNYIWHASSAELLGNALQANQQAAAAELVWKDAALLLDKQTTRVFDYQPIRRLLAIDLEETQKAAEIASELSKAGYRNPLMQSAHSLSGTFR